MKLRTTNQEVDPAFRCRICGLQAYVVSADGTETRPSNPGCLAIEPLNWLNNRLCEMCFSSIEIVFRHHTLAGQTLACIREIEKSDSTAAGFLEKREMILQAMLQAQRRVPGSDARGSSVTSSEEKRYAISRGKFTFYPEPVYPHGDPANNNLGHTLMRLNGVKGVAVYDLPPGAVWLLESRSTVCVALLASFRRGLPGWRRPWHAALSHRAAYSV